MLQYCMDKDVNDILTSTNITTEERQQYQSVIAQIDGLFQIWQNITFEQTRYTYHIKKDGETVEQYKLYALIVSFW